MVYQAKFGHRFPKNVFLQLLLQENDLHLYIFVLCWHKICCLILFMFILNMWPLAFAKSSKVCGEKMKMRNLNIWDTVPMRLN